MRLTDGAFNLTRLANTRFTGGNTLKSRCFSVCPTVINDLQDIDGDGTTLDPNLVFLGSTFVPQHSVNGGTLSIPNPEHDFPWVANHAYAGIFIDGRPTKKFGIPGASALSLNNANAPNLRFSNLESGIVANDATLRIRSTGSFNGMMDTEYADNSGNGVLFLSGNGNDDLDVVGANFQNSVTGIEVVPYGVGTGVVNISNNTMSGMQRGINQKNNARAFFVSAFDRVNILNNQITSDSWLSQNGTHNRDEIFGIYLVDEEGKHTAYDISGNTIAIQVPNPDDFPQRGLGIHAIGMFGEKDCQNNQFASDNCDRFAYNNITLNGGYIGLQLVQSERSRVYENQVFLDESPKTSEYDRLISIEGGIENRIDCNTTTSLATIFDTPNHYAKGLYIENHQDAVVLGNAPTAMTHGIAFRGECGTNTDVNSNLFIGPMDRALYYMGEWDNNLNAFIRSAETGDQVDKANQWDGMFSPHWNAYADFLPSGKFYTPMDGSSQDPYPLVNPNLGWFEPGNSKDPIFCTEYHPDEAVAVNTRDKQIAVTGISDAYSYFSQWYLYQKLVNNPDLLADQDLANFYNANTSTALGNLAITASAIKAISMSQANKTALLNLDSEKAQLELTIEQLLLALDQNPDDVSIQAALTTAHNSLEHLNHEQNLISESHKQSVQPEFASAATLLSSVNPTVIYEETMKWVMEHGLHAATTGELPDESDLQTLYNLATSCPMETGPATYMAHEVYANLTGDVLQRPNCLPALDAIKAVVERASLKTALSEITLTPNPLSHGVLRVEATTPFNEVIITDLLGKVCRTYQLEHTMQAQLITTDLVSGTYTITLKFTDGTSRTEKLIISK